MSAIPIQRVRRADKKGRVTLPDIFKGQPVLFRKVSETTVEISVAKVVPADEAWLHENSTAMAMVQAGLKDAASSNYDDNPPVIPDVE
jgi:hypothetical protein